MARTRRKKATKRGSGKVKLKIYRHYFDGDGVRSRLETLTVSARRAQAVVRKHYHGDGSTSVHVDTLRRYPRV